MRSSLLLVLLLSACGASAPASHTVRATPRGPGPTTFDETPRALASEGPQGVRGTVVVLTGDFMPPGTGLRAPAAHAPIHVLRGRHAPTNQLERASDTYLGSTTTDAQGRFQVALPPGTYTVLTERDGQPYLNSYNGDGTWGTVEVTADHWSAVAIQDTAGATF